ncbi:MAG: DUF4433 domain-containing protein [Candidatus Poribacteria bacterium]|nr:DUF4433 domain-containing protein [Candidatus Poribacteria bacterium]MDD9975092.1 DUF4433 domain-containing protein [Candidatus Poribacteria bacterium]
MQGLDIRALYYITHIDNLPSILTTGILSHKRIKAENIQNTTIYLKHLVNKRQTKYTSDGENLWHYANLFFQPRNSMLLSVIRSNGKQNIAVLRISNTVLQKQGIFITDGIASNKLTRIYSRSEGLEVLQAQQEMLQSDSWTSWNHSDKIRRQLMAECLVPNQVDPKDIQRFIVADRSVASSVRTHLSFSDFQKLVIANDIDSNIFTPFG